MDTKLHTHPCRPQTDIWSVCACVFEEGGCQPTETRGMVPVQNTHNQDQNLVPKEGIGSAGRVPPAAGQGQCGTGRRDWSRGCPTRPYGATATGASGHTDAQRRPPSGNTVGDMAGNIQGQWGGRPSREGWGHAVMWTHKHQGLGQFRKGGCTVLCTLPRCNTTFTQQPPASGSSVTSQAYWLPSVGTKVKTIQIPPSKWSPRAGNAEGRPPEATTTKHLLLFLQLLSR